MAIATFGKNSLMQTATFANLIETLFFIVVFYYLAKIVVRMFFPVVVKTVVRKAEESFREQQQRQQQMHREPTPQSERPKERKIVGEYIDYEEIE